MSFGFDNSPVFVDSSGCPKKKRPKKQLGSKGCPGQKKPKKQLGAEGCPKKQIETQPKFTKWGLTKARERQERRMRMNIPFYNKPDFSEDDVRQSKELIVRKSKLNEDEQKSKLNEDEQKTLDLLRKKAKEYFEDVVYYDVIKDPSLYVWMSDNEKEKFRNEAISKFTIRGSPVKTKWKQNVFDLYWKVLSDDYIRDNTHYPLWFAIQYARKMSQTNRSIVFNMRNSSFEKEKEKWWVMDMLEHFRRMMHEDAGPRRMKVLGLLPVYPVVGQKLDDEYLEKMYEAIVVGVKVYVYEKGPGMMTVRELKRTPEQREMDNVLKTIRSTQGFDEGNKAYKQLDYRFELMRDKWKRAKAEAEEEDVGYWENILRSTMDLPTKPTFMEGLRGEIAEESRQKEMERLSEEIEIDTLEKEIEEIDRKEMEIKERIRRREIEEMEKKERMKRKLEDFRVFLRTIENKLSVGGWKIPPKEMEIYNKRDFPAFLKYSEGEKGEVVEEKVEMEEEFQNFLKLTGKNIKNSAYVDPIARKIYDELDFDAFKKYSGLKGIEGLPITPETPELLY